MKVWSFLDASHPMKNLLTLPKNDENLFKFFHIAENIRSQSRRYI